MLILKLIKLQFFNTSTLFLEKNCSTSRASIFLDSQCLLWVNPRRRWTLKPMLCSPGLMSKSRILLKNPVIYMKKDFIQWLDKIFKNIIFPLLIYIFIVSQQKWSLVLLLNTYWRKVVTCWSFVCNLIILVSKFTNKRKHFQV